MVIKLEIVMLRPNVFFTAQQPGIKKKLEFCNWPYRDKDSVMYRNLLISGILFLGLTVAATDDRNAVPEPADPAWGVLLQWSKFAEVDTLPGLQGISLLNDGDLATGGLWCPGAEGSGELTIKFPRPIKITMFRFAQADGNPATKYKLTADTDGKGGYDAIIKEQTDEKPVINQLIAIPVERKAYGLKFTALEGKAGYRTPFPRLTEVEVYSRDKAPAPAAPVKADNELKVAAVKPLPEFKRKEIDIRISIETFMAGVVPKKTCGTLEESKSFQEMVRRFKEADANSARLFIEKECVDDEMPWKSKKLWPGHGEDHMAPLTAALHKNGLKVYFFAHAWMSPFQERVKRAEMPWNRWDYPYEQSDRLLNNPQYKVQYPCIISDNGFRDKWLAFLKEALEQGADGVYLQPDEYYFKGHALFRANCPLCTAEFKEMYGYDSMPGGKFGRIFDIEDSEQYRKWKLFEYRKIAGLFHYVSANLKKIKPSAQIVMSDNKTLEDLSGRLEHNMCLDIMENDPNSDLAQMYGGSPLLPVGRHSAYSRRISAAAGKDKMLASIQWFGLQHTTPEYAIQLFGYALPQIMLGARAYENYRLTYMYANGWWPNAIECHKIIRLLEQWGIRESDTPDTTCLLLSRASEDWWRTRLEGLCGDQGGNDVSFNLLYAGDDINKTATKTAGSERDRVLKMDALRGVGSKLAMESLLCETGIPYKAAFTDRLDNLENLKRFKLLIMPFSYSLSKDAFKKVTEAVEAGSKLIVFDQLAPVDEFGNPYQEPLLKQLLGNKNVIHVKDNLAAVGNADIKRAEYVKILEGILEPTGYRFNANGTPVECIVSCLQQQEGFLIYLGNWSTKNGELAKPLIALPFEDSKYKAEAYSSATKTLNNLDLAGKPGAFDGKVLKSFSVDIAPGEVKLLRIVKVK